MKSRDKKKVSLFRVILITMLSAFGIYMLFLHPYGPSHHPERPYYYAARSTLRNLATFQEEYWAEHGTYVLDVGKFAPDFVPDPHAWVVVLRADREKWLGVSCSKKYPFMYAYDSEKGGLIGGPAFHTSGWWGIEKWDHKKAKTALEKLIQAQTEHHGKHGRFMTDAESVDLPSSVLVMILTADDKSWAAATCHEDSPRLFVFDSLVGKITTP